MKWKHYLILCLVVSSVVIFTILYAPGVAGTLERELLSFLSTNAR